MEINGQRLTLDPCLTGTTRAMLAELETGSEVNGTSQTDRARRSKKSEVSQEVHFAL